MDPEKTMQFLLDQQAGHDERLAKLEANVTRLATIAEMQIDAHDRLAKRTAAEFAAVAEAQNRQAEAQNRQAEAQNRQAEAQKLLTEAQRITDEKMANLQENMNALIRIADGLIRRPPQ